MTTFWPNTNAHIHAHLWSTASSLSVGLWNGGPYVSEPLLPVAHRPHNQQISCTSPSASSHRWQVKITHTIAVRRPQLSTYNFQMRPATYYYYYHSQRAPVFSVLFRTTGSSVVLALHNTFLVHWFFCNSYTHTQLFNGTLSGTTRVSWYQKRPLSTHIHTLEEEGFCYS